jgi:hypothetical protein
LYDLENKDPELIPTSNVTGKSLKDSRPPIARTNDEEAEKEVDFTFECFGGDGGYAPISSCE